MCLCSAFSFKGLISYMESLQNGHFMKSMIQEEAGLDLIKTKIHGSIGSRVWNVN